MPEEGKKDKNDDKIVMRVDMDCEGCKEKVRKALKSIEGVEKIEIDLKEQKVTVKGNVDPRIACDTVKKRSGKRAVLLSPDLKNWEQKKKGKDDEKKKEDKKKEEVIIDSISKIVDSISDLLNPKPPNSTVVLKVMMHCGGCAKQITKNLRRMEGVTDVQVDPVSDKVTVKGRNLDANELCDRIRRSGKSCEIVQQPKKAEKKEDKKEEKKGGKAAADEKKEKAAEEKKEETASEEKKEHKAEGKKEGKAQKEEKKEDNNTAEIKKYEFAPYRSAPEYIYPPQLFSDENPNACSIM